MAEAVDTSGNTRDLINGKKVESRTTATAPSLHDRNKKILVNGVDEVLLSDGSIVYQCVRSRHCFKAFDSVGQVTPHLRTHGRPQAAARRDAEIDRENEKRLQQSAAGQKAQQLRVVRMARIVADEERATWLKETVAQLEEIAATLSLMARARVEVEEPVISPEELAELRAKAEKWDRFKEMTRD